MKTYPITLTVNGVKSTLEVPPERSLLDLLKGGLHLQSVKGGCGIGECGVCTVIMDGRPVNACLVLAVEAEGKSITTIEGIAPRDGLHPIQEEFLKHAALQCGVCTPGFIVATKALLDKHPHPTEHEVRRWLAGNLCRCTGYDKIVRAVLAAAERMNGHVSV